MAILFFSEGGPGALSSAFQNISRINGYLDTFSHPITICDFRNRSSEKFISLGVLIRNVTSHMVTNFPLFTKTLITYYFCRTCHCQIMSFSPCFKMICEHVPKNNITLKKDDNCSNSGPSLLFYVEEILLQYLFDYCSHLNIAVVFEEEISH